MLHLKFAGIVALGVVLLLALARAGTAPYAVTFQGVWNGDDHPTSTAFPACCAHFSPPIGATHSDAVSFWEVGQVASDGIEHMAETGATGPLQNIINPEVVAGRAGEVIEGNSLGSTATVTLDFEASSTFPRVTLVTMVAPSPDWFVGVAGLSLLDGQDHWINQIDVDLYAHDAGT